jgi:hypothetical protein
MIKCGKSSSLDCSEIVIIQNDYVLQMEDWQNHEFKYH